MEDINKNTIERPENIEDYIAKGIKDYRWSDEFLVKDLVRYGINDDEASLLIKKVKEERHINNKQPFLYYHDSGEENGLAWLCVVEIFFLIILKLTRVL